MTGAAKWIGSTAYGHARRVSLGYPIVTSHGHRRWRPALLICAVVLAVALGAAYVVTRDPGPERFAIEAPATARNAVIARDGWSARLHGRYGAGSSLTMRRASARSAPWAAATTALRGIADVDIGDPVSVELRGATLNRRGVTIRRTLPAPLADGTWATLAYHDVAHDAWRAVPTRIGRDRRTLTARVPHLTDFTDLQYAAGWLLDTRADAPTCDASLPAWIDSVNFMGEKNDPLRWCAGLGGKHRDTLVVRLVVNRSYGVAAQSPVTPASISTTLFEGGPEDLITNLVARAATVPDRMVASFGGKAPVMGGDEATFRFTEPQVREVNGKALVKVSLDAKYALVGFTYDALVRLLGRDDGKRGRQVAGVVALAAVAQCELPMLEEVRKRHWAGVSKQAIACLTDNSDEIAQASASVLTVAFPTTSSKKLGKLAGRIGQKLWQVWAAGALYQAATWAGDKTLDPAALELHAFPTIRRVAKPRPATTPPVVPPDPPAAAPASTFAPGDPFDRSCVVAWPTAPVRTATAIQLTMSCRGVPDGYRLVQVVYGDPHLPIRPSTGAVRVLGHVADVAASEYGYKDLVVQADTVTLP